ncbi:PTS system cellobiose-specific IIC component [Streptococcus pneumoniae]|nr:PTS system cellobiose-specific IIC component [Streptococcus pneumoniae]CNA39975.1 PTS system cellobiose-specific IIC component [Streptococcus pneumoniae]VME69598.1 PTS system cellobiose-specific IIC component [Streptococcus pneumoniae]VMW60200.1 PTS system cellobiose-specific IIC component [Streptococcus pneumoniae]
MPPIIGGFLATGASWRGALLQVVLILVSVAIYYPFFKIADKRNLEKEKATVGGK